MLNRVSADITAAMKNGEKEKLEALRYIKAMLIENKTAKAPKPELDVVIAHHKKMKDSLESFPAGHPMIEKVNKELKFIETYLPQGLSESEVKKIISDIISKTPGVNMGGVMKELTPQIKGRFDGKLANQFVKEALEAKK